MAIAVEGEAAGSVGMVVAAEEAVGTAVRRQAVVAERRAAAETGMVTVAAVVVAVAVAPETVVVPEAGEVVVAAGKAERKMPGDMHRRDTSQQ